MFDTLFKYLITGIKRTLESSNIVNLKPYHSNKVQKQAISKINNDLTKALLILFCATLISTDEIHSTVFCQSYFRNKRIYLNTRVLQAYVCMNDCSGSYKIVNVHNERVDFRASSHVPNVLNPTGFYSQTELSRLTIYLTKIYPTLFTPTLFLSNDHIKILPMPSGHVFSLDIYFCLLNVL